MTSQDDLVVTAEESAQAAQENNTANDWGGAGIAESVENIVHGIENGDWDTVGLNAVGAGLDTLGIVVDPLGSLLSAGFGWMIENVWFLREPFDSLMGNPDAIAGSAATWTNIGTEITSIAEDYRGAAQSTTPWAGLAGDAYRTLANDHADGIEQIGAAANGMAGAVEGAGVVVSTVRGIVRDLITQGLAELVSAFVKWGVAAALTAGIAVGGMVADGIRIAIKWAEKIGDWMKKLGTALTNLLKKLDDLGSGTHQIGTKIATFFKNGQGVGDVTWRSTNTPDFTLENLTNGTSFKPDWNPANTVLPTGEAGNIPLFTPGDDNGLAKFSFDAIKEGAKLDDGNDESTNS